MALLDEELVEYWLNNNGFFCMRGVKSGLGEIDFLCIRPTGKGFEAWQVEVTVSFRPIGYIGGNTNAKKRTDDEVREGVRQWVVKKFTDDKKVARRDEILPNANWQYVLVCGEAKYPVELDYLADSGVEVIRYSDVIDDLVNKASIVNSNAGNIVEILRYAEKHRR
ncbi:hypothetical protein MYE70_06640 [Marinobacter alexandrii]|uniref:hypothetical protein n=1 Tax=Marinobacter alexandrii TaxID=2570351 RepID=UPI001FFFCCE2|nr:hypothetical protein [Marinobacter alexandrii]MCK2148742.1 hypothetical protein [Marinobacter alexandrii]